MRRRNEREMEAEDDIGHPISLDFHTHRKKRRKEELERGLHIHVHGFDKPRKTNEKKGNTASKQA